MMRAKQAASLPQVAGKLFVHIQYPETDFVVLKYENGMMFLQETIQRGVTVLRTDPSIVPCSSTTCSLSTMPFMKTITIVGTTDTLLTLRNEPVRFTCAINDPNISPKVIWNEG